ncbi:hypothetical protein GGQ19_000070 [Salinibacter ruber]|nr:hypothetical protein [Salinibacter ruber]
MSVGSIGLVSNLAKRDGFFYPAGSVTQLSGHNPLLESAKQYLSNLSGNQALRTAGLYTN